MTTRFQPEVLEYEKANGETEHRETRFADSSSLAAATTRDSEKGSSRYASSTTGLEHVEANKKLERKLVRKLGQFKSCNFFIFFPTDPASRFQTASSCPWQSCCIYPPI